MSGGDFVVEPDRWTLPRRQTFGLRSVGVSPGPLKALTQQRRSPLWLAGLAGFGLAGLGLAAVTLAPRQAAITSSEPASPSVTQAAVEMPVPRVVGAAAVPVPPTAPVAAAAPALEPPALRSTLTEPDPAPPVPVARRPAAPALDVGQLPILELDAAAFEPPPMADPPRMPAKPHARTPSPRLAGQP